MYPIREKQKIIFYLLIIIFEIFHLDILYSQQKPELQPPKYKNWNAIFQAPSEKPVGLLMINNQLWIIDYYGELVAVDTTGKIIKKAQPGIVKPITGTIMNNEVWLLDKESRIYLLDQSLSKSGFKWDFFRMSMQDTIRHRPEKKGAIGALTNDGQMLLLSQISGYSSSIFQIDQNEGFILSRTWSPGPEPTGMVWIDKKLLILDRQRGVIITINKNGDWIDVPFQTPKGILSSLVFDGKYLWTLDTKSKTIYRTLYQ